MKTVLALVLFSTIASTAALAQPSPPSCDPCLPRSLTPTPASANAVYPQQPPLPDQTIVAPPTPASADASSDDDTGWHRPVGKRFFSGFRLGYMYLSNWDKMNRDDGHGGMTSIKEQLNLKTPNMFLLGYEGFYRVVGHSWLNVLMVGNVTVAGLEQSKFIPTASGLLGFEFERNFQLGVGVNLIPDAQAPSHMIMAAGFTPFVGGIQTPLHVFYIPDANGNSRMGATVGMNW
jgi:hypothetical protein